MVFKVEYDEGRNCVIGTFAGRLDMESAREYAKEIAKVSADNDCARFLNDLRGAEPGFSTLDIHDLPKTLHELTEGAGLDRSWRRAILAPKGKDVRDYDFFETVAANQGYTVKVFADLDKAMDWLLEP